MLRRPTLRRPRSIPLIYVRSRPQRSANASCEIPALLRSSRIRAPNRRRMSNCLLTVGTVLFAWTFSPRTISHTTFGAVTRCASVPPDGCGQTTACSLRGSLAASDGPVSQQSTQPIPHADTNLVADVGAIEPNLQRSPPQGDCEALPDPSLQAAGRLSPCWGRRDSGIIGRMVTGAPKNDLPTVRRSGC